MVLDWFNETRGSAGTVADLIARKKYARAIEALRAQFQGRSPDAKTRLQLADLMVLAGREGEAIPILISLADEFSVDGFVAKAVAILKRIEKLDPGRPDVEERLGFLVNRTYKAPPVRFAPPRRFEIGIEAEDEAQAVDLEPRAAEPQPELAAEEATAAPTPEAPGEPESLPVPEIEPGPVLPDLAAEPATPQAPEPSPAPAGAEASPRPAVARRIRSILGRLLAARHAQEESAPDEPPAAPEPSSTPESPLPTPSDSAELAPASPEAAPEEPPAEEAPQAAAGAEAEVPTPVPEAADRQVEEPLGELPDVTVEPEPEPLVAESEAAEPAPQVEAKPEPEAEEGPGPESMSHRIKGFLGRFWPGRRDEDEEAEEFDLSPASPEPEAAVAPEPTPEPQLEVIAAESEPELEPDQEAEPDVELLPEEAEPELEAEPAMAAAAMPEPTPQPLPEVVAAEPEHEPDRVAEADAESRPVTVPELEAQPQPSASTQEPAAEDPPMSEEVFQERLLDVIEDVLRDGARRQPRGPTPIDGRTLSQSPLLGVLSEGERLEVVRGLRLLTYEPGDIVLTEGEPGETLYLLTTGAVKVFVRNPASRNIEVRVLREGDFFGEVSILSGRPRTATITAASECELLELDRATLDALGHDHPGIVDTLEAYYIERTQSPDNAAVRAAAVADAETQRRAAEVLRAHFGDRAWDPKMRLKLADVLLKANKQQEALPILVDLADAMARQGHPEKAIAILKKIERIEGRHTEEINLAPLGRRAHAPPQAPAPSPPRRSREKTSEFFEGWMLDLVKDTVRRALPSSYRLPPSLAASAGLLLSPLFEDFTDEEIQALIDGLRLLVFEAGDIVVTEGEPGNSVFVVTSGAVKVFVRAPSGHNAEVCELGEGDFFGEISTLSGRPRSATVTATGRTEVLELDKTTLDGICAAHPRVRDVLEEVYIQRAAHPYAAKVRGVQQPAPSGGAGSSGSRS